MTPRFLWRNRVGLIALAVAILASLGALNVASALTVKPESTPGFMAARFCVDPDWPPYEVIGADGTHQGIAGDLLRLVGERSGVRLELLPTRDWDESLAAAKEHRCQVLSFLNQSPKRDEWLIFTDPLFVDPNVIITREEHDYVADLAALSDHAIVLPKGTSIEERVRRDFPNLKVVLTESEAEAFAMVSRREADLTLRSMVVAVHTIKKEGWFNLKIAGQVAGYENRLRVGVIKPLEGLRDQLNIGVNAITAIEREAIANRHVSITVRKVIDYEFISRFAIPVVVMLVTSAFFIVRLRRANAALARLSRTDPMTGLANRAAVSDRFPGEMARARRHGRPVSVILFDIDHFKTVNDTLGHLTGDQVLRDFAAIVTATVRVTDAVARWGGEEFLVLCPETSADQALRLAERVVAAVRGHDFGLGRPQTVSAGVAALGAGEDVDDWLRRADTSLYRAKAEGRDRAIAWEVGPNDGPDLGPHHGSGDGLKDVPGDGLAGHDSIARP